MTQLFQDAMAIVRTFGKPDIFHTMTCNPNWPEIQEQLLWEVPPAAGANHQRRKQRASDRPDIVAHVFDAKKKGVLKEINDELFGRVEAIFHTIEFQKRGLPHMHCLIFLHPDDKIHDADQVDNIVSAQLPDQNQDPLLYETITNCMLHGPCGADKPNAPCMVDGRCSKHYPKAFNEHTIYGENGYPQYARPNNGRTVEKNGHIYDNRYVIPYHAKSSARLVYFTIFYLFMQNIYPFFLFLGTIVISMSKYASQWIHADTLQSMSSKATTEQLWVWLMTKIVMRSRSTWMHAILDLQKAVGVYSNFLCMLNPP